jgi:hypothetical protein
MPKAGRAVDRFLESGVEMVLSGHLHYTYTTSLKDAIPESCRERDLTIVQCGTSTSRRGRGREQGKNSFNLIEITDSSQILTHYLYSEKDGFSPFARQSYFRPVTNRAESTGS